MAFIKVNVAADSVVQTYLNTDNIEYLRDNKAANSCAAFMRSGKVLGVLHPACDILNAAKEKIESLIDLTIDDPLGKPEEAKQPAAVVSDRGATTEVMAKPKKKRKVIDNKPDAAVVTSRKTSSSKKKGRSAKKLPRQANEAPIPANSVSATISMADPSPL